VIAALAAGVGTWSAWPAAKQDGHERSPSMAAASHGHASIPGPTSAVADPKHAVAAPPAVEHPVTEMVTAEPAVTPAIATTPAPTVGSPVARSRERAQVAQGTRAAREVRERQVVSAPAAVSAEEPAASTKVVRAAPAIQPDLNAPSMASSSQDELRLIRAALTALRDGHPGDALDALGDHARHFPRGALASQRAGLRVVALCDAGQHAQGVREQQAFLARDDGSALAQRVRQACASEPGR
jgi:hypothetical protein